MVPFHLEWGGDGCKGEEEDGRKAPVLAAWEGEEFRKKGVIIGPIEAKQARKIRLRNRHQPWILGHLEPSVRLTA